MGAAERRKGHDTERMVVRWLRDNGYPDAITTRAKLGHDGATAPGDVDFHPLVCLEVKNVARSAWPSWCRQAAAEAREGMVPVVVRRTPGNPDVGAWECRYDISKWATALHNQHPLGTVVVIDGGHLWLACTFAEFIAALHRFDTLDGAA